MAPIPVYLKTDADMPRPADPEFYWMTRAGPFLCRNHPFFTSDVPAAGPVRGLAFHEPHCQVRYPRLGVAGLEYIVGFFDWVYRLHGSESAVLLFWDLDRQRFVLYVPEQEATVWESSAGIRSPLDVRYALPVPPPDRHLLVGDVHSHGNVGAFASSTDCQDERYRDGVHAVIGCLEREPPEFHIEFAVDRARFRVGFDQVFAGYRKRRRLIPRRWLERVTVQVERPAVSECYQQVGNPASKESTTDGRNEGCPN
jgi:hypothetical protein